MLVEFTMFGAGGRGLEAAAGAVFLLAAPASGVMGLLWGRLRAEEARLSRERRLREEMECYLRLDERFDPGEDPRESAARVCEMVAARSPFQRVGLLLRGADQRLYLAASKGFDPAIKTSLREWATVAQATVAGPVAALPRGVPLGARSVVVGLGHPVERAVLVPLWARDGQMLGTLVVMAASILQVRREMAEEAVAVLEALAARLSISMEQGAVADRLLRVEKLAALGVLAGGIAHTLNNPLTVVMGCAGMIEEAATEERTRQNASAILEQSYRMQETIDGLINFWRPSMRREEAVDLVTLVRALAPQGACGVERHGLAVVLALDEAVPTVRGNAEGLRLVLEHLLDNAAQAIASMHQETVQHTIRVTVSRHKEAVQLIVSDTGPGFKDPAHVFDPFYTTQATHQGRGLGLSICYGIVREHGGEISVFNLYPSGAAVVVELPVAEWMGAEAVAVGEVA